MQSTCSFAQRTLTAVSLMLLTACTLTAQAPENNGLANNTVLIVRHAEKPKLGNGLTAEGEARARAYAHYFEPFHDGGENIRIDALYAGSDSDNSMRPRLTLEPLRAATGLPLKPLGLDERLRWTGQAPAGDPSPLTSAHRVASRIDPRAA